jgi:hypothetical protein
MAKVRFKICYAGHPVLVEHEINQTKSDRKLCSISAMFNLIELNLITLSGS